MQEFNYFNILCWLQEYHNDIYGKIMLFFIKQNKEKLEKVFFGKYLIGNFTSNIELSFHYKNDLSSKNYHLKLSIYKLFPNNGGFSTYDFYITSKHSNNLNEYDKFHTLLKSWFDKKDAFWNDLSNFENDQSIERTMELLNLNLL